MISFQSTPPQHQTQSSAAHFPTRNVTLLLDSDEDEDESRREVRVNPSTVQRLSSSTVQRLSSSIVQRFNGSALELADEGDDSVLLEAEELGLHLHLHGTSHHRTVEAVSASGVNHKWRDSDHVTGESTTLSLENHLTCLGQFLRKVMVWFCCVSDVWFCGA
mmetsp:Transcript_46785/g.110163  ORF Transcript_46785/g.110163 Transcript_46785/m.110163 type:complete len:162 (+) Transcript_46785:249-734(+)